MLRARQLCAASSKRPLTAQRALGWPEHLSECCQGWSQHRSRAIPPEDRCACLRCAGNDPPALLRVLYRVFPECDAAPESLHLSLRLSISAGDRPLRNARPVLSCREMARCLPASRTTRLLLKKCLRDGRLSNPG